MQERERVLAEVRRQSDPEKDGTKTWSFISAERIWVILQEGGYRWQKSRNWCETVQAARKRKCDVVTVFDPDAAPKKN